MARTVLVAAFLLGPGSWWCAATSQKEWRSADCSSPTLGSSSIAGAGDEEAATLLERSAEEEEAELAEEVGVTLLQTAHVIEPVQAKDDQKKPQPSSVEELFSKLGHELQLAHEVNTSAFAGRWYVVMGTDNIVWPMRGRCFYSVLGLDPSTDKILEESISCRESSRVKVKRYTKPVVMDPTRPGIYRIEEEHVMSPASSSSQSTEEASARGAAASKGTQYLIVGLGPLINGTYQYEVAVRDDLEIVVRSRDPLLFHAHWANDVLRFVETLGLNRGLNQALLEACTCSDIAHHAAYPEGLLVPAPHVPDFNLTQYFGKWYLAMADVGVHSLYAEIGGKCTVSIYRAFDGLPGWLTEHTICRSPQDPIVSTGYSVAKPNTSGLYQVRLEATPLPAPEPFFFSNYIISVVGPVINGQYEWDVVTTPAWERVWIRTRNLTRFYSEYVDDAVRAVRSFGLRKELVNVSLEEHCACKNGAEPAW